MFSDTYSDLANSFNEWADVLPTGGDYITNLALDYANRAQDSLWSDPPNGWTLLTRSQKLNIGGNLRAALPNDSGLILHVYADTNEDGKPDKYYFRDGRLLEGFAFENRFDKDDGHQIAQIRFFQSPEEPIYCDYQVKLDPFTGSGTEYLFFPKNIMLGKMQYFRCLDAGKLNEWQSLITVFNQELNRFKSQHQNPVEIPGIAVRDFGGKEIFIPGHNLASGLNVGGRVAGSENDRLTFRR